MSLFVSACATAPSPEASAGSTAPGPASSADARSVTEGVYTSPQASRGEDRFRRSCRECHESSEFSGGRFRIRWGGLTLGDMYGFLSTAMPEQTPGSLTPAQYADLVAYLLSLNGFPTGSAELAPNQDLLGAILIEVAPD